MAKPTAGTRMAVVRGPKLSNGRLIVAGIMEARELIDRYLIPRRDFSRKEGYQRELQESRVARLVKDMKEGQVNLPTALLLNIRDFKPGSLTDGETGHLTLNGEKLYVVDGQHRVEALNRLIADNPDKWGAFQIPFVCMLGATKEEEMQEFYVVNSTAKSVKTDLALELLKVLAHGDPKLMDRLVERGQDWKVKAQELTEHLEKSSPIWKGKVQFAGSPKSAAPISSSGLAISLKKLLGTPFFGSIGADEQKKILDMYWRGIRDIVPEAFDAPHEYTIQKSIGVSVLHAILPTVIEYIRSKGLSLIDSDSYKKSLASALRDIEGDLADGGIAKGVDFWRTAPNGAAGMYSSNAGRRVLIAKFMSMLPKIQVE